MIAEDAVACHADDAVVLAPVPCGFAISRYDRQLPGQGGQSADLRAVEGERGWPLVELAVVVEAEQIAAQARLRQREEPYALFMRPP